MSKRNLLQICLIVVLTLLFTSTITISGVNAANNGNNQSNSTQTSDCFSTGIIAINANGDIFFDSGNYINKFDRVTGQISRFAGVGRDFNAPLENVPATMAFIQVDGMTFDRVGNLIILDKVNNIIRRIDAQTGIITTIAGKGNSQFDPGDDGPAISASLGLGFGISGVFTQRLAVDSQNNIYFADPFFQRIRKIDNSSGLITSVAEAIQPFGLIIDNNDNLYFIESLVGRVRKLDLSTRQVTTIADVRDKILSGIGDLTIDAQDNLYIIEGSFSTIIGGGKVLRINLKDNNVSLIGGRGNGFNGDDIPALMADFKGLSSIVAEKDGNLVISDTGNARLRRLTISTGLLSTIAKRPNQPNIIAANFNKIRRSSFLSIVLCRGTVENLKVEINGFDVTTLINTNELIGLTLKGTKRKLKLKSGINKLVISGDDFRSDEFSFTVQ